MDHNDLDLIALPPLSATNTSAPASEHDGKETLPSSPSGPAFPSSAALHKSDVLPPPPPPSARRQNIFMVFITLTQLVQMIPLGAGINSSLALGDALGASRMESVWIVASYPLTQGSFVLIGKSLFDLL